MGEAGSFASALHAGDGAGVRQLLRGTPSLLHERDFNGDPFLISAIRQGSPSVVRPLLGLLGAREALDLIVSTAASAAVSPCSSSALDAALSMRVRHRSGGTASRDAVH